MCCHTLKVSLGRSPTASTCIIFHIIIPLLFLKSCCSAWSNLPRYGIQCSKGVRLLTIDRAKCRAILAAFKEEATTIGTGEMVRESYTVFKSWIIHLTFTISRPRWLSHFYLYNDP
jgi:hypothetical protein